MSVLAQVTRAVEAHGKFVARQVERARRDKKFSAEILQRWREIHSRIESVTTPTGIQLPRLALPQTDEPGQIAQFIFGEGSPGEFPFVNGAYREMYLAKFKARSPEANVEEPTRLFAGLGLAEDTNKRLHYLTQHQPNIRLSTAFDGPTLYGLDSDADGVFGKVGEGGVAIDTIEDMERLYAGFPLNDDHFSVSMTINGPA